MNSCQIFSALIAILMAWIYLLIRSEPVRFTKNSQLFQNTYGEWAIVAGASEGLGAAWADALCEVGVHVVLVARREHALKELTQQLQNKYKGTNVMVDYWVQDLADPNLDVLFKTKILNQYDDNGDGNRLRQYGFLVYNAASSNIGSVTEIPLSAHQTTLDVNTRGVIQMTHTFSNYLQRHKRTGGMILMSSLSGEVGTAFVTNYAATKAWNTAYAHGLRHELQPYGIDVLACVAGPITTPNYVNVFGESRRNEFLEQRPDEVVSECLQSIGVRSSVRTGIIGKLSRFVTVRLLPLETALSIFHNELEKMLPP